MEKYVKVAVAWDYHTMKVRGDMPKEKIKPLPACVMVPVSKITDDSFMDKFNAAKKNKKMTSELLKAMDSYIASNYGLYFAFHVADWDFYQEYDVPLDDKYSATIVAKNYEEAVGFLKEYIKGINFKIY